MQLPTKKQIPYGGTETLSFQDGMVKWQREDQK